MNVLVVGLNNSEAQIQLNNVLLIKADIFLNNYNRNEYCLKVYALIDGVESDFIGYIGREFLPFRECYENKLAQVIKIYGNSTNSQERAVSAERDGACVCRIVS
jgi:hypothetical protein